jgi:hypothetical protein
LIDRIEANNSCLPTVILISANSINLAMVLNEMARLPSASSKSLRKSEITLRLTQNVETFIMALETRDQLWLVTSRQLTLGMSLP